MFAREAAAAYASACAMDLVMKGATVAHSVTASVREELVTGSVLVAAQTVHPNAAPLLSAARIKSARELVLVIAWALVLGSVLGYAAER